MKKVIILVMAAVLVISLCFGLVGCSAYSPEDSEGRYASFDTKYFGSYPQTIVKDKDIISALGTFDSSTWTSYGYYVYGEVSDCMYYIDKTYNGEKYRGVYIASYRPVVCDDDDNRNCQRDHGYMPTRVYWFKYEPIEWHMFKEEDGTAILISTLILDSQPIDYEDGEYSSNYAESTIRKWLNDTFYNTAFSASEKEVILTTRVDNSSSSTGNSHHPHECEDTYDKIFLLSYVEATTYYYSGVFGGRIKTSSSYARSQGLSVANRNNWWRTNVDSCWWLRSPDYSIGQFFMRVDYHDGDIGGGGIINSTDYGVVPALVIQL